jgi:hypothetical protein
LAQRQPSTASAGFIGPASYAVRARARILVVASASSTSRSFAADRAERRAKRHLAESLDAHRAELLEPNLTAKEADRWIAILKAEIGLATSF